MLHFNLQEPVELVWFGEFISPERDWKHLTRQLYEYELMIVTEGTLCIADEHEEYEVRAGEYLIMSPTRFQHGTKVCRCRFYWLHFRCPALPASLSLPALGRYCDEGAVHALAARLFDAERIEHRGVRSRYLATALLLELYHAETAHAERAQNAQQALCAHIKSFVEWHRFSPVLVSDIARELGYHEKYLSAVFRKTEGITLKRYLIQERLKEAKRLLLDTNYTVAEVAYYLNFQSPHNFSRFFKQEAGCTPCEYRANPPRAEETEQAQ